MEDKVKAAAEAAITQAQVVHDMLLGEPKTERQDHQLRLLQTALDKYTAAVAEANMPVDDEDGEPTA